MKVMKFIPLTVTVILTTIGVCKGGPSPAISYLINTPVSMMDFGMYQLEQKLEKLLEDEKLMTFIVYNWDKNRISISATLIENYKKQEEAKEKCTQLILRIKRFIQPPTADGSTLMTVLFSHAGYQLKSHPKGLYKELDNITEIDITASYEKGDGIISLTGKSSLLETDIFYSEKQLPSIREIEIEKR